ncbi:hypothetical protein T440DRAFT_474500 [Plenodomus tracheiphilus IPT5]|uniref:Uncharacterized protein n=1 Tax=Plenodomus tracheiphilus IPT5 TaxID=1408161 RepID=A0A6A7BMQ2_9PLEO|nr:hypothetical protein T440DRAFT_474500 [Plenodomus tracheiphilus IPT5]
MCGVGSGQGSCVDDRRIDYCHHYHWIHPHSTLLVYFIRGSARPPPTLPRPERTTSPNTSRKRPSPSDMHHASTTHNPQSKLAALLINAALAISTSSKTSLGSPYPCFSISTTKTLRLTYSTFRGPEYVPPDSLKRATNTCTIKEVWYECQSQVAEQGSPLIDAQPCLCGCTRELCHLVRCLGCRRMLLGLVDARDAGGPRGSSCLTTLALLSSLPLGDLKLSPYLCSCPWFFLLNGSVSTSFPA